MSVCVSLPLLRTHEGGQNLFCRGVFRRAGHSFQFPLGRDWICNVLMGIKQKDGSVQVQVGQDSEQSGLVESVPAQGREWNEMIFNVLPTQTILGLNLTLADSTTQISRACISPSQTLPKDISPLRQGFAPHVSCHRADPSACSLSLSSLPCPILVLPAHDLPFLLWWKWEHTNFKLQIFQPKNLFEIRLYYHFTLFSN